MIDPGYLDLIHYKAKIDLIIAFSGSITGLSCICIWDPLNCSRMAQS